jgi:hypothetical protein
MPVNTASRPPMKCRCDDGSDGSDLVEVMVVVMSLLVPVILLATSIVPRRIDFNNPHRLPAFTFTPLQASVGRVEGWNGGSSIFLCANHLLG